MPKARRSIPGGRNGGSGWLIAVMLGGNAVGDPAPSARRPVPDSVSDWIVLPFGSAKAKKLVLSTLRPVGGMCACAGPGPAGTVEMRRSRPACETANEVKFGFPKSALGPGVNGATTPWL